MQVNPFITTMGMMSIGRGLTYCWQAAWRHRRQQYAHAQSSPDFLGAGYVGPVPFPVIEMVILVVSWRAFPRNTVLGRQIYGVGSNEQAAMLSGVNVGSGPPVLLHPDGLAGRLRRADDRGAAVDSATNAGIGTELDVIAAAVIGGASLAGGEGTVYGAVIGAAIMAVLRNAFVLLGLPVYLQTVSIGVVIILAVALDGCGAR